MYKGRKNIQTQELDPMFLEVSVGKPEYSLVHLVKGKDYSMMCGFFRYKFWQNTRRKVTCAKCLEALEEVGY